jgi:hypothetical protein
MRPAFNLAALQQLKPFSEVGPSTIIKSRVGMLKNDDLNDVSFDRDSDTVETIADALREKYGYLAMQVALKQIGLASSASIRTWLAVYQRLVEIYAKAAATT